MVGLWDPNNGLAMDMIGLMVDSFFAKISNGEGVSGAWTGVPPPNAGAVDGDPKEKTGALVPEPKVPNDDGAPDFSDDRIVADCNGLVVVVSGDGPNGDEALARAANPPAEVTPAPNVVDVTAGEGDIVDVGAPNPPNDVVVVDVGAPNVGFAPNTPPVAAGALVPNNGAVAVPNVDPAAPKGVPNVKAVTPKVA